MEKPFTYLIMCANGRFECKPTCLVAVFSWVACFHRNILDKIISYYINFAFHYLVLGTWSPVPGTRSLGENYALVDDFQEADLSLALYPGLRTQLFFLQLWKKAFHGCEYKLCGKANLGTHCVHLLLTLATIPRHRTKLGRPVLRSTASCSDRRHLRA